jgi:hypothetical protein
MAEDSTRSRPPADFNGPNRASLYGVTLRRSMNVTDIWLGPYWFEDSSLYVVVAAGMRTILFPRTGATIQLDNHRFEWFCGGAAEPDTANDEWAACPEGTFLWSRNGKRRAARSTGASKAGTDTPSKGLRYRRGNRRELSKILDSR